VIILHGINNDGILAHSKIIVAAPNSHVIFITFGRVSEWIEFGQPVDIVKIAVTLILMLFVQLFLVKGFVIKCRFSCENKKV
jgi:hypothetical protein